MSAGASASSSSSSSERSASSAFIVAAALLVALALHVIWASPYVPATDMPGHMFGAVARARLDAGDTVGNHAAFLDANRPLTANGLIDFFALLEPSLGWRNAYRATATLLVLTWMLSSLAFVIALDRRRAWMALIAASTAFGWNFYQGFWAFAFGTALSFLFLAMVVRAYGRLREPHATLRPTTRVLLALALLVVAAAHFFAAVVVGGVWLAIVLAVTPPARRWREVGATLLMAAPAALLAVAAARGGVGSDPGFMEVLPFSLRVASWGEATIGGPLWRQLPLLVAMACGVASVALLWRRRTSIDRALVTVALFFLAVPLVVPWSALGWQHFSPRALPFAALLLCAAVPLERLDRAPRAVRALIAAACVTTSIASVWWARELHRRASDDMSDVLRAADSTERARGSSTGAHEPAGYRWPFVLVQPPFVDDASLFRWDPLRGVGNLFGIVQGGFPAYAFVNSPSSDAVLLRDDLRTSLAPPMTRSQWVTPVRTMDGDARRAALEALVGHTQAAAVDGVILVERPEDHAAWLGRGFVADIQDGRVLLARFEGCALDVTGATTDIATTPLPVSPQTLTRTDDVRGDARLERLPCGLVEVRGCGPPRTLTLSRDTVPAISCTRDP